MYQKLASLTEIRLSCGFRPLSDVTLSSNLSGSCTTSARAANGQCGASAGQLPAISLHWVHTLVGEDGSRQDGSRRKAVQQARWLTRCTEARRGTHRQRVFFRLRHGGRLRRRRRGSHWRLRHEGSVAHRRDRRQLAEPAPRHQIAQGSGRGRQLLALDSLRRLPSFRRDRHRRQSNRQEGACGAPALSARGTLAGSTDY